MDSGWLEDFLALIECKSFSRAAERRGASQSAFSRRIRLLEEWVGGTLVDRSTHTLKLTAAGARYRIIAEEAVRLMRHGRAEVRAIANADSEVVRFASTSALSFTFFADWIVERELDEWLGARFGVVGGSMSACERMLVEGRVHFLLGYHHDAVAPPLGPDFISCRVGEDALIPVAASDLANSSQGTSLPTLWYSAEAGIGRILAATFAASGTRPPPEPAFVSHSSSLLMALAKRGRGIAWVPLGLARDELAAGRLVRASTVGADIPVDIRVWRSKSRQAPLAELLWSSPPFGRDDVGQS